MLPEATFALAAGSPTVRRGALVAVVGPSGAGKDTLIASAASRLRDEDWIRFARRVVTRDAHAASEEHDSLTEAEFGRAQAAGAFSLTWQAHGLQYALPHSVAEAVSDGLVVVANLSRKVLPSAIAAFGSLSVVEITAPPELLLQRIVARGRETQTAAAERIRRRVALDPPAGVLSVHRIDNAGVLDESAEVFVRCLEAIRRRPTAPR